MIYVHCFAAQNLLAPFQGRKSRSEVSHGMQQKRAGKNRDAQQKGGDVALDIQRKEVSQVSILSYEQVPIGRLYIHPQLVWPSSKMVSISRNLAGSAEGIEIVQEDFVDGWDKAQVGDHVKCCSISEARLEKWGYLDLKVSATWTLTMSFFG